MKFEAAGDAPAIPTYRLMDTDGVVIDPAHVPKVSKETAVKMYRDMVAGMPSWIRGALWNTGADIF